MSQRVRALSLCRLRNAGRINAVGSVNRATQLLEMDDERVGDATRTSSRNGPADRMCRGGEHQRDGRTQRPVETQKRMGGETRKQGTRARACEMMRANRSRGEMRADPKRVIRTG